jgi:hypothetical protein
MLFLYTLYFSLFERIFSTNQHPLVFYLIIIIILFCYLCKRIISVSKDPAYARFARFAVSKHNIFFFVREDIVVIGKSLRICGILIYRCLTHIKSFILVWWIYTLQINCLADIKSFILVCWIFYKYIILSKIL